MWKMHVQYGSVKWRCMKLKIKVEFFYLKKMLFSMQMEEGESISEHLLKLKNIKDQLQARKRAKWREYGCNYSKKHAFVI